MLIVGRKRRSKLATCLGAAPNFRPGGTAAAEVITRQICTTRDGWDDICGEAELTEVERNMFSRSIFLNDFAFEGAPEGLR